LPKRRTHKFSKVAKLKINTQKSVTFLRRGRVNEESKDSEYG
jgi:hypothetical protein